jgi:hypothetical protein
VVLCFPYGEFWGCCLSFFGEGEGEVVIWHVYELCMFMLLFHLGVFAARYMAIPGLRVALKHDVVVVDMILMYGHSMELGTRKRTANDTLTIPLKEGFLPVLSCTYYVPTTWM